MTVTTEQERPLDLSDAANYLHISKGSLYNLVHFKKITFYKPGGKLLYFLKKDLDAYISKGRILANFEVNRKAEDILNA